jgi:hypothetical protein
MLKSALETVHNGQPGCRYPGTLIRSRVNHLTLATLAHVVGVGECPAQAILQVGDRVIGGLVGLGTYRRRVGLLWGNVTDTCGACLRGPVRG